jgi:subtilase family serine protease
MAISSGASMRVVKSIFFALLIAGLFSSMSYAATRDRVPRDIGAGQMVALKGNVHGLAQSRSDLGRVDASKMLHGVTLVFRPSVAQQQDLDNLLAQQQDRSSPNYHKWLTPSQFADRFGMTTADIQRVVSWLQSQGFAVTSVSNSRNEISFDGTVSQVEVVFQTEIHNYLVNGEIHFANATDPSVPAALAGSVLAIGHLHDFAPKPRAIARPHLTSYVSGNHFVTPDDFATIYDVAALYSGGSDGTGQKIAIVGQSSVATADLKNFRSAAGLPASTVQMTVLPATTSTRCAGDEGESDLDIEWAGGVAKNATIIFVYAGLSSGDTCTNRNGKNVWDALDYAVQNKVAPFISTSYGFCEGGATGQTGVGQAFAQQVQQWAQQANSQGQTIVSASGDSGAADCDGAVKSATQGLAVDVPSSIPEVTGMGGSEFSGDAAGTVTGTAPNTNAGATTFWSGTSGSTDAISSALSYISEVAWNETAATGTLSASGGGASIFFTKPAWQTGTGVPADGKRDVPDLAISSSPNHDGFLVCSEDASDGSIQASCTSGFRTGSGGTFNVVGGTSVAAPTFAGILALINQSLGTVGLGNVNPNLYSFAASTPSAFHDVTSGNNMVPCTSGSINCPSGTTQIGFSAGTGYDQVTGLGSVDANKLATAWLATETPMFSLAPTAPTFQVTQGASVNATVNVTFASGFAGTVTFTCTDNAPGSVCNVPAQINTAGQVSFNITTTAATVGSLQPSGRGTPIFYAALLPGLLGIIFTAGKRRTSLRGVRFLGLIVVLGFSTVWLASCGGSSASNRTSGTTRGNYAITVSASSPGAPTESTTFQLVVQ